MKTKYELIRFIQSLVRPRILSVQVSSKDGPRALIKELDKQTKISVPATEHVDD